jgi:hypothetical protein
MLKAAKKMQETEEKNVVILDLQAEDKTDEKERTALDFPKMRILHICDKAGVAGLLAKYQRLRGHEAVVMIQKGVRSYDHETVYSMNEIGLNPNTFEGWGFLRKPLRKLFEKIASYTFLFKAALIARKFDVIHIHDNQWLLWLLIPFKNKVLEFHGTDLRQKPARGKQAKYNRLFLRIFGNKAVCLVSTVDLLKELPSATWLPNPVDLKFITNSKRKALLSAAYFLKWYESTNEVRKEAFNRGWNLTIVDHRIPYCEMPEFLSRFEYIIDRFNIPSLSKTALEALAAGCKVLGYDGQIHEGLPINHSPLSVASASLKIYRGSD